MPDDEKARAPAVAGTIPKEAADSIFKITRLLLTATEYAALRTQVENGELHPWVATFFYFLKFSDEDDTFLEFSIKGMNTFLSFAEGWEAKAPEKAKTREVEIRIAKREKANGFSSLHNSHTVSLWNMLDATLFEGLVHLFLGYPKARELEDFRKIKFNVGQYETLSRTQMTRMALVELKREISSPRLNKGVRVYEQIHRSLGMEPHLPDDLDKKLIELRAMRNAIVHNMGIVDERVLDDCGWLQLPPGTHVGVKADQYKSYKDAALRYVGSTLGKTISAFPMP